MAVKNSFGLLGLDARLVRSIEKKGLAAPTDVQFAAISKVMEGKDVVVRARTGSGKTLAYLLPLINSLLRDEADRSAFQAVVMVPTSELCEQV
jgi:ATP-dependent RNA helicase DDX56/DBP9